jgi:hypothetical protein
MAQENEGDRAPREQPVIPTRRPWHAPEFHLLDLWATAPSKNLTKTDNGANKS